MNGRDFRRARPMLNEPSKELQWLSDQKFGRAMRSREVEPYFISRSGNSDMDQGLDWDLSLNIGSKKVKRERDWEEEVDSSLTLTLFSPSRQERCSRDVEKDSKLRKLDDEEDGNIAGHERVTSTRDLTI